MSGGLALNQRGVGPGTRLPKDAEVVKDNPDCFVDVVPGGLSRDDAVLAKYTITAGDVVVVYAGQWINRHHCEVERHPARFELPGLEGTTLDTSRQTPRKKE
jgi:hypothetical protein